MPTAMPSFTNALHSTMNNGVSTEKSVPLLTQASSKTIEESQEEKFLRLSLKND